MLLYLKTCNSILIVCCALFCFFVGDVKNTFADYPGECVVVQAGVTPQGYNNYDYHIDINIESGSISFTRGQYYSGTMGLVYIGIFYYENGVWHGRNRGYYTIKSPLEGNWRGYENRYPGDPVNAMHNRDIPPLGDCDRPPCPEGFEKHLNGGCVPICEAPEIRNPVTNECTVCPSGEFSVPSGICLPECGENQVRDINGICQCAEGMEELSDGSCVPECGEREIRNEFGKCIPDPKLALGPPPC